MKCINHFLLEYEERIKDLDIDFSNTKPPKNIIKRFIRLLKKVPDPRMQGMIVYPLIEIIVIAFLAVLGGADGWNEIECFGKAYKSWLKKLLKLENGVPSHDTFGRVFGLLNSVSLEKVTVAFMSDIFEKLEKKLYNQEEIKLKHICVDGKEQKGTGRKYNTDQEVRNLQTLHIYDNSHGICLYSKMIEEKTNEIPTAQELLKSIELKDSIITFDAMNTQKKTVAIIKEQHGDYVGALKENQQTFYEEVKLYFIDSKLNEIKEKDKNYLKLSEKAHNHIEVREYYLTTDIHWFSSRQEWSGLKSFICYVKNITDNVTGKESTETRYYISSLTDLDLCQEAIRGHWGVENSLHWHLDVTFGEDDNTTMNKIAFNNLSITRKMALSLLKLAKPVFKGTSIKILRKRFGWKMDDTIATTLNFITSDELIDSLSITK